ncbi:MAG: cation diffusion facilitator family transporter [Actinomycetales bacterium]
MSTEGGTRAIVAALSANLGIAVAKFVAFLFTRSSSMLAESIHSVADSGNQVLLLVGSRRARRAATAAHPFGYGRERYVYAFLVALVLFLLGGVFAIYEGWHKISEALAGHGEVESPVWAFAVLIISIGLEGFSFRTAMREANVTRGTVSWVDYIRRAKAPELPVVLLEDTGALIGLVLALVGVTLAVVTGNAVWDGAGTLAIGLLLLAIALVLAIEMKSLLVGEGASPAAVARIEAALLADPTVGRVIHMRTLHLGPEELLVAAKIAVRHDETAAAVAATIDAAERRVREVEPIARVIYLEPDIDRG